MTTADGTERPAHHRAGRIQTVQGRGSNPGEPGNRGLPPVADVTFEVDDGTTLRATVVRPDGRFQARPMMTAPHTVFDRCPICFSPSPATREHVPPQFMGGHVLTLTCADCNSGFGSQFEPHLRNWWDDAFEVRFSAEDVTGLRNSPRVLVRPTEEGPVALVLDVGRVDPAISEMFASGAFTMHQSWPSERHTKVALLKSAYLAICCLMQTIPEGGKSERVRTLLRSALADPDAKQWDEEDLLAEVRPFKSAEVPDGRVELVAWREASGATLIGVSLARAVLVPWMLETIKVVASTDVESITLLPAGSMQPEQDADID